MKKINIDWKKILTIATAVLLTLAHAFIILVIYKSSRYYAMYPKIFNYVVIIVICLFIIIDIVFFIGFRHKDLIQKIIVCVLAIFISIGGFYGTKVLSKTNTLIDSVMETDNSEQKYETVSGLFVTYNDKYASVTSLTDLKQFSNLTIGYLNESSEDSITSIGLAQLEAEGITSYTKESFTNNTDLLFALIGGKVDVAIFTSMYRAVFRADENVDYEQYLDNMNEFGEFSKDIVVESNQSKKDLSKDPFNVLLIGWSPIIGSTTIGLADAIIVASVNPQTFTVSMMSIARDSYVPISCYGGECDKINSGRGTSMDCFVSTVENLIGEDIDFYMEINFAGFAELCGELGGIEIDNPVSFELDGVYVPAGHYVADGWQALQFARERHHMPNGDFDRQQHQKEVIMQIAKKFLTHDLTFALDVFNEISDTLNTNMTFNQLASVFNLVTQTKNYTGLSTFDTLDMHALRITGYADWHYSDEYELPLWIYRLYEGSISESLTHMQEVLGNYETINQENGFYFNMDSPYERAAFYSTSYDEVETHETLPPYYVNLTKMTYVEALEWANANGATLIPTFISSSDANYDESLDGYVVSQSVAYGKKVSKYPTCNVTVMGDGSKPIKLPDSYSGWTLEQAKTWCKDREYDYSVVAYYVSKSDSDVGLVKDMSISDKTIVITYYAAAPDNSTAKDGSYTCNDGYTKASDGTCSLTETTVPDWVGKASPAANYGDTSVVKDGITYTITYQESTTVEKGYVISQSPSKDTKINVTTTSVSLVVSSGAPCDHTYGDWVTEKAATCTEAGSRYKVCTKCGNKVTEVLEALGHAWGDWQTTKDQVDTTPGEETRTCNNDLSHKETRSVCTKGTLTDGVCVLDTTDPEEETDPDPEAEEPTPDENEES